MTTKGLSQWFYKEQKNMEKDFLPSGQHGLVGTTKGVAQSYWFVQVQEWWQEVI